jgi:hypothetical protein
MADDDDPKPLVRSSLHLDAREPSGALKDASRTEGTLQEPLLARGGSGAAGGGGGGGGAAARGEARGEGGVGGGGGGGGGGGAGRGAGGMHRVPSFAEKGRTWLQHAAGAAASDADEDGSGSGSGLGGGGGRDPVEPPSFGQLLNAQSECVCGWVDVAEWGYRVR